jgi:hypothetical protein
MFTMPRSGRLVSDQLSRLIGNKLSTTLLFWLVTLTHTAHGGTKRTQSTDHHFLEGLMDEHDLCYVDPDMVAHVVSFLRKTGVGQTLQECSKAVRSGEGDENKLGAFPSLSLFKLSFALKITRQFCVTRSHYAPAQQESKTARREQSKSNAEAQT